MATEALPFFEAEARERQGTRTDIRENIPESERGKASEHAGKLFGVCGHQVSDAKAIKEKAPEDFEAIKSGEKTIS